MVHRLVSGRRAEALLQLIHGTSPMAELVREYDWSSSPLGPIGDWPAELVSAVNTVLSWPTPATLYWGPEFFLIYNDGYQQFLSGKHPHSLGQPASTVWRELWPAVRPDFERVFHEGQPVVQKDNFLPSERDGLLQDDWWTYTLVPLFQQGAVAGILNLAENRTSAVMDKRELSVASEQLQLTMGSLGLAAWFYDPVRNVVGGDERMAQLFGVTDREAPAAVWLNAIHEEDRPRVAEAFAASLQGAPYDMTYRVNAGAELCWLHARASVVTEQDGRVRMVGICEDVTHRTALNSRLSRTSERLVIAQQVSKGVTFDWCLEPECVTWGGDPFGRNGAELPGSKEVFELVHVEDRGSLQEAVARAIASGEEYQHEFRAFWPDGSVHWVSTSGRPLRNDQGQVDSIVGMNLDISERKTAEMALLRTEKLAAVGRLASTIAHEINNPLEAVTNLLYLCQQVARNPEVSGWLAQADAELRRMAAIAQQTLRFHRQATAPQPVTCTDLFSTTLDLYEARIHNSRVTVEKRKRALEPVICFEGDVRQVLSNLVTNALDAMPQGGRLLVRSREGEDWRTGRRGIVLTVADTGAGMSQAVRQKIFEAFFTTKGIGGTGLGLWISADIVARHHGRITVRTSDRPECHGTVFCLFLPFDQSEASSLLQESELALQQVG